MKKKLEAPIVEAEERFNVENGLVSWDYKRGVIELTVETLDYIFYQYSKHGLNMTAVQVQNKHGFDALQWQSLKRTFDLVKDSDVFSPYTLSQYSGKEQCDMIASKIAEKYSPKNMRDVIEYEDNKQTKKAYEKAIKEADRTEYKRQQFESGILEYITQAKEAPVVKKSTAIQVENAIGIVADLHYGADIARERNLPAFNEGVIAKKLADAAKDMNSRGAKNMKVIINGDLIETFTGLNHINSWKNISKKNGYGTDATIAVTKILTKFLSQINNISDVTILSGNHDRITSNNKEDVSGEVAKMVAYILNARFGEKFTVNWVKDVYSFKVDKCGFIITHGHLGLSKKNPESIINHYGFSNCFNLVVMAHLHTRKILSDGLTFRVMHGPSIFTGNDFSKNLGYSSLSGYLYITVAGGRPVITDYPLA